jgi:hypothetical protein
MAKSRKRQDDTSVSDRSAETEGNGSRVRSAAERINMRAYELYLARGGADGQAMDDWLTAERELSETRSNRNPGDTGE